MKLILSIFLWTIVSICHGETYLKFEPGDTIGVAKQKYPNAQFVPVDVGWATKSDKFIRMSGQGIVGEVYLKFSASDEFMRTQKSKYLEKLDTAPENERALNQNMVDYYTKELEKPDDERMSIDWIRWVPEKKLPIERVVGRYGKATKCDYDESSFEPYCDWGERGITAALSDDKKWVAMIDFKITPKDWEKKLGLQGNKGNRRPDSSFDLPPKKGIDKQKNSQAKAM